MGRGILDPGKSIQDPGFKSQKAPDPDPQHWYLYQQPQARRGKLILSSWGLVLYDPSDKCL